MKTTNCSPTGVVDIRQKAHTDNPVSPAISNPWKIKPGAGL